MNPRGPVLCAALVSALAHAACAPPTADRPAVSGWFASWRAHPDSVAFDGVSDVFYAFALPTPDGGLDSIPRPDRLRALVARGGDEGFGVHLTVGGWNDGDDTAFETLAADSAARERFARALADAARDYGLAGVEIDWEHPDLGPSAAHYLALVRTLDEALRPAGIGLAVAVAGSWAWGGGGVRPEVFDHVDRVHVMAYAGGYGRHHSSFRYARSAIDLYLDMGAPAEKLFLGVPFYGLSSAGETMLYREILAQEPDAATRDSVGMFYYNGRETLLRKARLVDEEGLGGLIAWDLTADATGVDALLGVLVGRADGS
ncbi:MAG: glycoside hydrolase family 18 protein [Gemmatimonadota bacterium]